MSGFFANFSRRNRSVPSVGRWYIHDSRPSANMFFARSASFLPRPVSSSAPMVRVAIATLWTWNRSQRVVLERVGVVADLRQVALRELVGVDDEDAAVRQVDDVRLERGGVHRDEHVGTVARRQDVVVGEVQLERRHTGQRALWCADLGGEVGLRGEVVAERRRFGREPVTGELHTVTGVAGEADHDAIQLAGLSAHSYADTSLQGWPCPTSEGSRLDRLRDGPRTTRRDELSHLPHRVLN